MTYSVEPMYRNGHVVEGEWVLLKDRHLTGISSIDWPRLEEMCALLNLAPDEMKARAKDAAYRKTVMGAAA